MAQGGGREGAPGDVCPAACWAALGLGLTPLGGCQGEAALPACSPLPRWDPLVSTACLGPDLPTGSAATSEASWGLRAVVFSGADAPGRGSWAPPGPRSPGEGSGLQLLGPRKAFRVLGSSTRTATSSRNREKGSLASCRRLRRARGLAAGWQHMSGGSGVGDACVSTRPGPAAQPGPAVWPLGLPPGLGLRVWLRGSSLRAPSLEASASCSSREPWLSFGGLLGSEPWAWELALSGILLSQASPSVSLTLLLSSCRAGTLAPSRGVRATHPSLGGVANECPPAHRSREPVAGVPPAP